MNCRFPVILLAAMLFQFPGCSNQAPNTPQTNLPRSTAIVAGKTFSVQIAATAATREKGYMYTPTIPDGEGMVFVFPQPGYYPFWNHNVPISLDVIYIRSDQTVDSVTTMPAQAIQSFPPASDQVQFVLETSSGTASTLGLKPGDKVTFGPEILAAVKTAQ